MPGKAQRPPNPQLHPALFDLFTEQDAKGMPLLQLSEKAGYHYQNLRGIRQRRVSPSFQLVVDLAEVLGYDIIIKRKS
jgi:lambda repressor-like predicted transcriptional regulator